MHIHTHERTRERERATKRDDAEREIDIVGERLADLRERRRRKW